MSGLIKQPYITCTNGRSRWNCVGWEQGAPATTVKLFFHDSISDLEPDWRKLERTASCTPFQRLSWLKPLYDQISINRASNRFSIQKPLLISGYQGSKLVLVLPMVIVSNLSGKYLKWVGSNVSDYNGLIVDDEIAADLPRNYFEQIIKQIPEYVRGLDAIYLARNPLFNATVEEESVSGTKRSWSAEYHSHALDLNSDWDAFYSKLRSSKTRQRLRSKYRALRCNHQVSFKRIRPDHNRIEAAKTILEWKSGQLMGRGSRNPFGCEVHPSMTREAILSSVSSSCTKSIRVCGLHLDGNLVAGMLAFVDNGKFYYLVSAYSPQIPAKYSIGTQLLIKTLELASRSRLRQYDFLIGDEAYKLDWCNTRIPLVNHLIYFSLKGRLYGLGIEGVVALKKLVLASPRLSAIAFQTIKVAKSKFGHTPTRIGFNFFVRKEVI